MYNAIISRSAVFEFKPVSPDETKRAITRALDKLNHDGCAPGEEPGPEAVKLDVRALELLASRGAGDVRRSLGLLENAYYLAGTGGTITTDIVDGLTPKVLGSFDKAGDVHYDLLSCLQKSIRGSDPDAAVFYLAKLLEGGDILSACRRLQVIASEDIGLAYPMAAVITKACVDSARELGLPEARHPSRERRRHARHRAEVKHRLHGAREGVGGYRGGTRTARAEASPEPETSSDTSTRTTTRTTGSNRDICRTTSRTRTTTIMEQTRQNRRQKPTGKKSKEKSKQEEIHHVG